MSLHPVEQVSWHDCMEVMRRMDLELPTEAQWEYAARSGTDTIYWTGDEVISLEGAANIADRHAKRNGGSPSWPFEDELDDGYTVHAPVGRFKANPFGLHDVHGNIWEWCRDGFGHYGMPVNPTNGERHPSIPRMRVLRGGSFYYGAWDARSAVRWDNAVTVRDHDIGLRAARPELPARER